MFSRAAALTAAVAVTDAARTRRAKGDGYGMYEGKPLIELKPCEQAQVDDLLEFMEERCIVLADEVYLPQDGSCVNTLAVCTQALSANDVTDRFQDIVTLVSDDAAAYFRATSGTVKEYIQPRAGEADTWYAEWRSLSDRMARVESAVRNSGGVATISTFGQSFEGQNLRAVTLRGAGYSASSGKRAVFVFNIHAREWIAGMSGVYAVEKLIEQVRANPSLIAGTEVVMIPMANPDGFAVTETSDRMHRKNTNGIEDAGWFCKGGIDLNRNFDSHWATGGSSGNRCSDTYHGPSAASEPETQAITALMESAPMSVFIDIHAYTQVILAPWGWTRDDHPKAAEHEVLGEAMRSAIQGKHGKTYSYGPTAQTLYPASGIIPDLAAELGALGYCYELRPRTNQGSAGFAPPASEILPTAEECFEGLLVAIEHAKNN